MKLVVKAVQQEFTLEVSPKTSLGKIFKLLLASSGIHEIWYFGLMYYDTENGEIWVDQSKKTLKDIGSNSANLHFKVKYYPENIGRELIETITIEYFFFQAESSIVRDEIYCPDDTCVLLASYALQAKHGDYNSYEHVEDTLTGHKLIPDRLTKQHNMDMSEWYSNITSMWSKHKDLGKEEAMLEYLKLVQKLKMYGISYFPIKDKEGSELFLGVTAVGLNIYKKDNRLNPTVVFPWSEIWNLSFVEKKFQITLSDKSAPDFVIFTQTLRMSKVILNLGMGNHSLYMIRKKPDSPEIVKMKEDANKARRNKLYQK